MLESVAKDVTSIKAATPGDNPEATCHCCGNTRHPQQSCKLKNAECFKCGQKWDIPVIITSVYKSKRGSYTAAQRVEEETPEASLLDIYAIQESSEVAEPKQY